MCILPAKTKYTKCGIADHRERPGQGKLEDLGFFAERGSMRELTGREKQGNASMKFSEPRVRCYY